MMSVSKLLFPLLFCTVHLLWTFPSHAHHTIHVFVALCDNEHQGVVPVPPKLGNGDDPGNNLFWGACYGVRSFFQRSSAWTLVSETANPRTFVLERCVFRHRDGQVYVVADAYRGEEIRAAIEDFLNAAAGCKKDETLLPVGSDTLTLCLFGNADLVAYIGHDGLMDFDIEPYPAHADSITRDAIVIACISNVFFREAIQAAGAYPLVWTTGLLAAEAYPLKAAIDGWILGEHAEQIRVRAARAYDEYQKCGLKAARNLFVTGF